MNQLGGKVAIVTGATRGIGRAIARSLLEEDVRVCVGARSQDEIKSTITDLEKEHSSKVTGVVCDVRSPDQIQSLFARAVASFGGVDILVNNAGIGLSKTVEQTTPDEFRAVLETNLFGVFYCCREAIPLMKTRGGGYIINISSLAGANPHAEMAAYTASKFALNGFSEALMQEVRHDNIKVSYVMPGSVDTEFGGIHSANRQDWKLAPEDVATVVMDLLHHTSRSLASRVEIRPSKPPKK